MDSIVSFELAKRLKEHGFDKCCYYFYDIDGKIQESYLENGSSSDTYFRVESSDLPDNFNSNKGEYSAVVKSIDNYPFMDKSLYFSRSNVK